MTLLLMLPGASAGCMAEPDDATHEVIEDDVAGHEAPGLELVSPGFAETEAPGAELLMEAEACTAIVKTYSLHGLDIGCPTTIKLCPGLFRDSFGVACMQYPAANVENCLGNIESATTCEEIRAAQCDIVPVWGSEPAGCDAPQ